ncbi:trypsin-like serine peptidase [Bacillus solitudinis]|uniref:trypsin-like serine peptidase n=1 Tax=Bacillus solitudinis TaxID=2014074 RepID=UPI000C245B17|nr:serine protease [Bacillus solitudinis]
MIKKNFFKKLHPEEWKGTIDKTRIVRSERIILGTNEKIIGANNLMNIAWLSRGVEISKTVGRVSTLSGRGTGFLIAPHLLITNNHVIQSVEEASTAYVEFDFERDWLGNISVPRRYYLDSKIFLTNAELDYTIVGVTGNPSEKFGYFDILKYRRTPIKGEYVTIIQHPAGRSKEIALHENEVRYVFNDKVQYTTDTENGSSGAIVLDKDWNIVALHHKGGDLPDGDGTIHFINQGISIQHIIKDAREFLGLPDELFDYIMGPIKAKLEHIVYGVTTLEELKGMINTVAISFPLLPNILNDSDEIDPFTAAGLGVATGAVIRLIGKERESILPELPFILPNEELVSMIKPFKVPDISPYEMYTKLSEELLMKKATLIQAIMNTSVKEDLGIISVPAGAFLVGVVVGSRAVDGKL